MTAPPVLYGSDWLGYGQRFRHTVGGPTAGGGVIRQVGGNGSGCGKYWLWFRKPIPTETYSIGRRGGHILYV